MLSFTYRLVYYKFHSINTKSETMTFVIDHNEPPNMLNIFELCVSMLSLGGWKTVMTYGLLQLEAVDGSGLSTADVFLDVFIDITINDINDAPVFSAMTSSYNITESQTNPYTIADVDASDQDPSDIVTFNLASSPAGPFSVDTNSEFSLFLPLTNKT